MSQLRVVIVEDHALVRAGMRALLQKIEGVEVVSDVGDGWEAVKSVQTDAPDLVLMDIAMPGLNGLDATLRIVKESPTTRVILLSMHANEEYVLRSLRAGADIVLTTGQGSWLRVYRALLAEAHRSPAFRARVRQSAGRVLRLQATLK